MDRIEISSEAIRSFASKLLRDQVVEGDRVIVTCLYVVVDAKTGEELTPRREAKTAIYVLDGDIVFDTLEGITFDPVPRAVFAKIAMITKDGQPMFWWGAQSFPLEATASITPRFRA